MLEQQSILALLQTFEVTARHLSFTLAAHEMNLNPGSGQPSDPQAGDAHRVSPVYPHDA